MVTGGFHPLGQALRQVTCGGEVGPRGLGSGDRDGVGLGQMMPRGGYHPGDPACRWTLGSCEQSPPAPPAWIGDIPIIGESVSSYWQSLALNAPAFLAALGRFTGPATDVALASGAFIGVGLLELGLSVFIAFFFYLNGRQIAAYVRDATARVAGHRARRLLKLIGSTIKGVIFGLIGTALAQGLLAALGFWTAGVEQALLFGFFTFILSFCRRDYPSCGAGWQSNSLSRATFGGACSWPHGA